MVVIELHLHVYIGLIGDNWDEKCKELCMILLQRLLYAEIPILMKTSNNKWHVHKYDRIEGKNINKPVILDHYVTKKFSLTCIRVVLVSASLRIESWYCSRLILPKIANVVLRRITLMLKFMLTSLFRIFRRDDEIDALFTMVIERVSIPFFFLNKNCGVCSQPPMVKRLFESGSKYFGKSHCILSPSSLIFHSSIFAEVWKICTWRLTVSSLPRREPAL